MLSPYRVQSNSTNERRKRASNATLNNNSHHERNVKRFQKTSNDLETTQTNTKPNRKNKNIPKAEPYTRILKLTIISR